MLLLCGGLYLTLYLSMRGGYRNTQVIARQLVLSGEVRVRVSVRVDQPAADAPAHLVHVEHDSVGREPEGVWPGSVSLDLREAGGQPPGLILHERINRGCETATRSGVDSQ